MSARFRNSARCGGRLDETLADARLLLAFRHFCAGADQYLPHRRSLFRALPSLEFIIHAQAHFGLVDQASPDELLWGSFLNLYHKLLAPGRRGGPPRLQGDQAQVLRFAILYMAHDVERRPLPPMILEPLYRELFEQLGWLHVHFWPVRHVFEQRG